MNILFFIILIGICIGSFLNVCIYRIPNEESITFPPSHCRYCRCKLKVCDLIPVFSYIFLRGECRSCKEKISIQYPLVEITNTVFYIILYMKFGLTMDFFKYSAFISILLVIGIIDYQTKYVYKITTIFALILGILFLSIHWIKDGEFPGGNVLGAVIGFSIIYIITKITGGMGEGDKEVSAICGLFLGGKLILFSILSSIIAGGIVALIFLIFELKDGKDTIAFGPYLMLGSILAIFFGDSTIMWYLSIC